MSDAPRLVYSGHSDISPETEIAALAAIYRICLERSHAKKKAAGVTNTNDTTVRHAEGVGDVGQRPD